MEIIKKPNGGTYQRTDTKVVFCKLQFQGIHAWPGCPFEEVAYLRDPHRHMFEVKAYAEVFHDDRDIEFIMLKNAITKYIAQKYPDGQMGSTSCEMLAMDLLERFNLCKVEVNEDGENGAIVTRQEVQIGDLDTAE